MSTPLSFVSRRIESASPSFSNTARMKLMTVQCWGLSSGILSIAAISRAMTSFHSLRLNESQVPARSLQKSTINLQLLEGLSEPEGQGVLRHENQLNRSLRVTCRILRRGAGEEFDVRLRGADEVFELCTRSARRSSRCLFSKSNGREPTT